jgi:hypothetical protein
MYSERVSESVAKTVGLQLLTRRPDCLGTVAFLWRKDKHCNLTAARCLQLDDTLLKFTTVNFTAQSTKPTTIFLTIHRTAQHHCHHTTISYTQLNWTYLFYA